MLYYTIYALNWLALLMVSPPTSTTAFHLGGYSRSKNVYGRNLSIMSLPPRLNGESDNAYFQRLTTAAADPDAFERLALQQSEESSTSSTSTSSVSTTPDDDTIPTSTQGKYVRVEEWEKEQQRKRRNGQLSWEERVAFDGQRHGNRFRQNEILRNHLSAF